jgi:hypothetical protein
MYKQEMFYISDFKYIETEEEQNQLARYYIEFFKFAIPKLVARIDLEKKYPGSDLKRGIEYKPVKTAEPTCPHCNGTGKMDWVTAIYKAA